MRDARRGRLVSAANAAARALGVLPQMPLSQAGTLCPDAQLVEHDTQTDIEVLRSLAESAQCFSPIVGIEQLDSQTWAGRSIHQPQSILLDVTGIAPLFGGESQLATAVHQWVAAQGYFAAIAIADRVGAAWALANYSCRNKIANDLAQFESNGRTQVLSPSIAILGPREQSGATMYPMPIEALRLDQATVTKLHRLGIRKIGALMELPRAGLASRFDDSLLQRIDQTLGDRNEPVVTLHPSPDLSINETLEHPTPLRETIDAILEVQIRLLTQALNTMGHGVIRLVCRIEMERNAIPLESDQEHHSDQPSRVARVFQIGLYQPSNDPEHLHWLIKGQLDAHYAKGPSHFWARSICVQATLTAPISWQQNDLFDRHSVMHRDAIAKLVDNLSARMGRSAVVAPAVHRDPQPELSYSWRPLTGWRHDGIQQDTKRKLSRAPKRNFAESRSAEPHVDELWRRPMRLIHPTKPIAIEHFDANGLPSHIFFQNKSHAVQRAIGPERMDSGWWNGATQQRDYYRIELQSGAWLWIYRNRRDQQWAIHGEFD